MCDNENGKGRRELRAWQDERDKPEMCFHQDGELGVGVSTQRTTDNNDDN